MQKMTNFTHNLYEQVWDETMEGNEAAFVESGSAGIQGGNSVALRSNVLGQFYSSHLESLL